ncbi:MAG: hypothetical protein IJ572_05615 [Bacilli bacterium]|nr:hypothetical protein [Bacilli bacterium]
MNNILKYYYNFKNIEIFPIDSNYLIMDEKNYTYLFYKIDKNININFILNILNKIRKPNYYGNLILNTLKNYISKYEDNNYILIEIKGIINEEITLNDLINNNIKYRYLGNEKNINLIDLWSKKIDYLEYQISQLSKNKQEVLNTFTFYSGLAENAISFLNVNKINYNNTHKTLTHTRISCNPLVLDYYNPVNILIDYDIRDYAEYIKSKVLKNDDILKDIIYILDNASLSIDDVKLFYARLMFPTLYFDLIEDILLNNIEEKEIDPYIENIERYINMLKDTYLEIKKRGIYIDIPDWIKKES